MTILMELHGVGSDGSDLRAIIREVQVYVDLETHRPKPLPDVVRQKFTEFDQRPIATIRGEAL
jgi:acyl-CoA thioesterase FadM